MKIRNLNPKVSVLIANYNNSIYLDRCINSVLNQSYKNKEIIFVDDKSSDDSIQVVKKYLKKIKIIKIKKKIGIGSLDQMKAYFEAYKKSNGNIIFFLDSDDYFHKNKISVFVEKFLSNNKLDILFDFPIKKFPNKVIIEKKKKKFYNNYWSYIFPTSCISVKKKKIKKIFRYADFKKFPDIWLDFRIGIVSNYIFNQYNYINRNLTYYRQSEDNISSGFKHLSVNWWRRRMQAHNFIKFFFKKNKIHYKPNLDYFLTYFVNLFIV